MAQNPLLLEPTTQEDRAANPLAQSPKKRPARAAAPMDAMHAHAQVWQHVSAIPSHELGDQIERNDYSLPVLGALAGNPKVTGKDVIKALANAAADNMIDPSRAVSIIQEIPDKPEAIQPWLRALYAFNLTAAVHMKAMALQQEAAS